MIGARPLIALAAALLALAGCGSDETLFEATLDRVRSNSGAGSGPATAPAITREQLNALPYAVISVQLEGVPSRAFLGAQTNNGGRVTYMASNRRSVVLEGMAVSATHGLGYDLVGLRTPAEDPLVTPTPPRDWPKSYIRIQRYRGGDLKIFSRAFACVPEAVGPARIEIVELTFSLIEMRERCANSRYAFENRHWVDPITGAIWKTRQWIGPRMGTIDIEVVRPFAG